MWQKLNLIKKQPTDFVILLLILIIGCCLSALLKNETTYDLMNYHYYNAFAFLHNRYEVDFFPAFGNTYLNPLIELPLYFYIKFFNNFPCVVYALQGIWFALSLFMLFKISALFFDISKPRNLLYICLILVLATIEKPIWMQIGSSTNEIPILFFSLWGIYVILKMIKYPDKQSLCGYFCAGVILGCGMGLKLTMSSTCVAVGITLIICLKKLNIPFKYIIFFAFGGLLGFLVTNGWSMWYLWQKYDNPFFPYMNNFFKSEYAEPIAHRDTRNIRYFSALFPYVWLFKKRIFVSGAEPSLFFYLGFALLQITFILSVISKKFRNKYCQDRLSIFLFVFLLLYYLIWYYTYTYLRYSTPFSALLCVFVVKALSRYNKFIKITAYILLLASFFYKTGCYRGTEINNGTRVIDTETIYIPENTTIYTYGDLTAGFAIYSIKGKNSRIIAHNKKCHPKDRKCGHMGDDSDFMEKGLLKKQRDMLKSQNPESPIIYIINQASYPFFHLGYNNPNDDFEQTMREWRAGTLPREKYRLINQLRAEELNDQSNSDVNKNYYCRALRHNILNHANQRYRIYICVPKEIKNILTINSN